MKKQRLIIITGASSGLGQELAQICQSWPNTFVWTISRHSPSNISANCRHFPCDLSDEKKVKKTLPKLKSNLAKIKVSDVTLVNNAAMIGPIGFCGQFELTDIQAHIQLNLTTPIILINFLLEQCKVPQTIINISSGAAHTPITNWSLYCASKAGLLMFTKCLQSEAPARNQRMISFSPGLIDTPMQAQIRATALRQMKDVQRFKSYKKEGLLRQPDVIANALSKLIADPSKFKKAEYEIQDLLP